jgi:hypothetical protein
VNPRQLEASNHPARVMRWRRDDGEDWPVKAGSLAGTGTPDTEQAVRFRGGLVQLLVSGPSAATVLTMGRVRPLPVILKVLGYAIALVGLFTVGKDIPLRDLRQGLTLRHPTPSPRHDLAPARMCGEERG